MLRRLSFLLGLVMLVPLTAHAQDKVELFGGYSYLRVNNSPSANLNGWELAGQYKVNGWLGGVFDLDGHYGSPSGISATTHDILFGPQVCWPSRISPFAHVLVGGAHVSSGGFSNTSLAMAIGGGIDTRLAHGIYWRVIQGDYLVTRFFGTTQNNTRVSTGIVFRF